MLAQFTLVCFLAVVNGNTEKCESERAQLTTKITELQMERSEQLDSTMEIKNRFEALKKKYTMLVTKLRSLKGLKKELKALKKNHSKLQRECQCEDDVTICTPDVISMSQNRTPETTTTTAAASSTKVNNMEVNSDRTIFSGPIEDVRLAGNGYRSDAGRVEIFYKGSWGTICDGGWDISDAIVICRMLGFPNATAAPSRAFYGEGTGSILLNYVGCSGGESSINDCIPNGFGANYCSHSRDASVVCGGTIEDIRLVGSDYQSSVTAGRVEILYGGKWGTICDDDWGINDANVVCKMLGFSNATNAPTNAAYGRGNVSIWLNNVDCDGTESSIDDCTPKRWGSHYCGHYEDASVVCNGAVEDLRLVGYGNTSGAGRVEIFYGGLWGTICDIGWDINDANVICRMLGYPKASGALSRAVYGPGSGPIWMRDLACVGTESSIGKCKSKARASYYCSHRMDASVVCNGSVESVRLAGEGRSSNAGRVEILYGGKWGTICHDGWDLNDASVICRMLGFHKATAAPSWAFYGEGVGTIWLSNLRCDGMESSIEQCKSDGWGENYCYHHKDASVVCDGAVEGVRLAGNVSKAGRVEILYGGAWGTICDDDWDIKDATVICKMLGFSTATAAPPHSFYGQGTGFVWLTNLECVGTESSISECKSNGWSAPFCSHLFDASVVCNGTIEGVRLVGTGDKMGAGRVEIFYGGKWGTICDNSWDINDANVICRMLGFPNATAAPSNAFYGRGNGSIWLDSVDCSGCEQSITDCASRGWGVQYCSHENDASVVCNGSIEDVRLVGNRHTSSAGRVEILYGGSWGGVCHIGWDINDANTICRMLGFSEATAAPVNSFYGKGLQMIWLNHVNCLGNESSIADCDSDGLGVVGYCNGDASVICNGYIEEVRLISNERNSNEGRVEILYAGEWGTVCDDHWDINDATVICRMLGFSNATAAPTGADYGRGSGFIWLDDVKCLGNESSIAECGSNGWGVHFCNHYEDASVICGL